MNIIHKTASLIILASLAGAAAHAGSFDFKDPKGVNNVAFSLDAPLESISGTANGISGTVTFDPAHPEKTSGEIVLDTSTLMVANSMMRDHILGEHWMNVEAFPTIVFTTDELTNVTSNGNVVSATVKGSITIKETTKQIEVPVTLNYLPGKLVARNKGMEGDLLVISARFSVLRNEFGINAGQNEDKVANEIELKLNIAGAHAK